MNRFYSFLIAAMSLPLVAETFTTVDISGAQRTVLVGVNHFREALGNITAANGTVHSFLYQIPSGKLTPLPDFPGSTSSIANGLNDDGLVAGDWFNAIASGSFIYDRRSRTWTNVPIRVPGSPTGGSLNGINNTGQTTGSAPLSTPGFGAGFVGFGNDYFPLVFQSISSPSLTQGMGITGKAAEPARVVGQAYNGGVHGFLWSIGNFLQLDFPGFPTETIAHGIFANAPNSSIRIVGEYASRQHGFLARFPFSASDWSTIDVPDADGTSARGINDAGVIVGSFDKNGTHGFVRLP